MLKDSNELDLQIGYPVLILSKTDGEIYPGIVYKQTIQKSIKGESSVWMIMVGPKEKRKSITTDKLDDFLIFKNIGELREALFKQIMKSIESSVKDAVSNLKEWYQNEIPLNVLASALQNKPTEAKSSGGKFVEAKNMSFAELAGQDAASVLAEQAQKEKKRQGRKPKKIVFEEATPQVEEIHEAAASQQEERPPQEDEGPPEITESKIRIKVKAPDGSYTLVDADSIDSIHDINF
jgi:hypothetical protein